MTQDASKTASRRVKRAPMQANAALGEAQAGPTRVANMAQDASKMA